jgi:hypothetical protein
VREGKRTRRGEEGEWIRRGGEKGRGKKENKEKGKKAKNIGKGNLDILQPQSNR